MNKAEMKELSASLFLGQVTLDCSTYREAHQAWQAARERHEEHRTASDRKHVESVRQFQDRLQQSDVVFVSPATGGVGNLGATHWLSRAVEAAVSNMKRVQTLTQSPDISVLNIVHLPCWGMLKLGFDAGPWWARLGPLPSGAKVELQQVKNCHRGGERAPRRQ